MTNFEESPGASRQSRIKKIAAGCGRLMEGFLKDAPINWSGVPDVLSPPAEQAQSQPIVSKPELSLPATPAIADRTYPE